MVTFGTFWDMLFHHHVHAIIFFCLQMNFLDLANLLDNDGNMQNEMMVMAFAATLLSTIPVLLGNEFDINVGLKR